MRKVISTLGIERLLIILDEWSVIPYELQPYMADIIRRCFLPIKQITIKFAAIEHRANFLLPQGHGQYTGIEIGADLAADVNLDDFMVFDNDGERSKEFFTHLIYNHLFAIDPNLGREFATPASLRSALFNQMPTFEEFVRSCEGVPRDALHLLSASVQAAYGQQITMPVVRKSADTWFVRDKSAGISDNNLIQEFLARIVSEVIGHRKARAFLLEANSHHDLIEELFDARLLHVLKKNISSHDNPGVRYNAYKLDYGCYVNLTNTSQATKGLLNTEVESVFIDVPPDDWRSIRRAILDPKTIGSL